MFVRREGTDPNALPIMVGISDTQPTGGKYDGVLVALAGLGIIRTMNDLDIRTKRQFSCELDQRGGLLVFTANALICVWAYDPEGLRPHRCRWTPFSTEIGRIADRRWKAGVHPLKAYLTAH